MAKKLGIGLAGLVVLLVLYLLFWPVPVEPVAFIPLESPPLTGMYASNDRLQAVETMVQYPGLRPEEVAFDDQGHVYAGTADGHILRLKLDGSAPALFADTGGRPNGMAFDRTGNLIVADAKKGLLSIASDGSVAVLATEANNRRIALANDLAIAIDGTIYFTDSQLNDDDGTLDFMDGRPLGRLLAYDPRTRITRLVLDDLYYANGVTLAPDESFVLVSESLAYRVTRYWLAGSKQGQIDHFVSNLPGLPDNITFNDRDTYWLALYQLRDPAIETLQAKPFLRKVVMRLPSFMKTSDTSPSCGFVLGLDLNGRVIHNLQDPSGEFASRVSSVTEHEGFLYLGTFGKEAIHRISAP
jgi:sugar lactone lactonase YvrE